MREKRSRVKRSFDSVIHHGWMTTDEDIHEWSATTLQQQEAVSVSDVCMYLRYPILHLHR